MSPVTSPLNILLINQYYPPDTSATAVVFHDVVSALTEAGHRVTVLCGRPSYQPEEVRPRRLIQHEHDGSAVVERLGSTGLSRRRMSARVLNYLSFFALGAIRSLIRPRPDVVVVGSDPPFIVWLGLLAARGRPVVYSLRDLHPEFALASGMIRPGVITRLWEWIHRQGLLRCSLVVCLGESMASRVRAKGVIPDRIQVVYDGSALRESRLNPDVISEIRGDSEFVVVHAGNLGGTADWQAIFRASQMLDGMAKLVFVGDGFNAEELKRAGATLAPFQPVDELASVMAAGDLQMVAMRSEMEGLVVPSKLFTVLAHGRPVLAVTSAGSEVARIVTEYQCGLVVDPDQPADLVEKVSWARSHPDELLDMAARAFQASARFDRATQLNRFVDLVEIAAC